MSGLQKTVSLCLVFVIIVLGMLVYRVTRTPLLSIEQLRERDVIVLPIPREIAPFSLLAHNGEPFELADLEGSWSFIFSVSPIARIYVRRPCRCWLRPSV